MKKNNKKKQQQMLQRIVEAEKEKQMKQEQKRLKKKQKHDSGMNVESASNEVEQTSVPDWNTFNNNNNNSDNMQDDDDDYDMSIELPHKRSSGKTDDPQPCSREFRRKKPRKFYAKRLKKEEKKAQMQAE